MLLAALARIERELQRVGLWGADSPPAEALASAMPFCHDTLAFHEWLQWIFLPRMRALLHAGERPPHPCRIHALAEHSFAEKAEETTELLSAIADFDAMYAEVIEQVS
jgi:uncharacterized protein YqcC (DUF446 family)